MTTERFEVPRWECIQLLRGNAIGRLCIVDQGTPIAIPINFTLIDDDELRLVVRTSPDSMIGRYEGPASLETDDISIDRGAAWSVIVRGTIRRVAGAHVLPDPKPIIEAGRHQWLTLSCSAISGRRFVIRPADDFSVDWQLAEA